MAKKKSGFTALLAKRRRWIQGFAGAGILAAVSLTGISLWWVLAAGAFTGIIFGKVFCRWMCPLGFFMELMTGMGGSDKFQSLYQYHKMGCPIAWVSGALNKFSLFKIRLSPSSCVDCGACDSACYISTLDSKRFSLYKDSMDRPGEAFACSKCMACVSSCPTGSLSFRAGAAPKGR